MSITSIFRTAHVAIPVLPANLASAARIASCYRHLIGGAVAAASFGGFATASYHKRSLGERATSLDTRQAKIEMADQTVQVLLAAYEPNGCLHLNDEGLPLSRVKTFVDPLLQPNAAELRHLSQAGTGPAAQRLANALTGLRERIEDKERAYDQLQTEIMQKSVQWFSDLKARVFTLKTNGHESLTRRAQAEELQDFLAIHALEPGCETHELIARIGALSVRLQTEMDVPQKTTTKIHANRVLQVVEEARLESSRAPLSPSQALAALQKWKQEVSEVVKQHILTLPSTVTRALAAIARLSPDDSFEAIQTNIDTFKSAVDQYNFQFWFWESDPRLPISDNISRLTGAADRYSKWQTGFDTKFEKAVSRLSRIREKKVIQLREKGATEEELQPLTTLAMDHPGDMTRLKRQRDELEDALREVGLAMQEQRPGIGEAIAYSRREAQLLADTIRALESLKEVQQGFSERLEHSDDGHLERKPDHALLVARQEVHHALENASRDLQTQRSETTCARISLQKETQKRVWVPALLAIAAMGIGISLHMKGTQELLRRAWQPLSSVRAGV